MTQDYSRPRQRLRSFGAGLLSGGVLTDEGMASKLQENIQFRLQSFRGLLMGQGGEDGLSPMERRQEIRAKRQELLGDAGLPIGGSDGDDVSSSAGVSGTTSTRSMGSGSITDTATSKSSSETETVSDGTPSMSEVDKGTKARAADRGYEE